MEYAMGSPSEADSVHAMAIRAAEGIDVPQDWAVALDHLQRAAHLGSRLAHAELAALSGEWTLALDLLARDAELEAGSPLLRNSIDLAEWLEFPRKHIVSETPRIAAVKDFASPGMCDWLIARARPKVTRAMMSDRASGERNIISSRRTNSSCTFRGPDRDLILAILRAGIAGATGMPVHAMESPHVLHYAVGQEFLPHFDAVLDPSAPDFAEKFAQGQQRVLTFLLSLNDDYEGGETTFPALGMTWKGRQGRAMFFWNADADGAPDQQTLHAGRPVTRGEKWMLSQWIGGRPAEIDLALARWADRPV